MEVLSDESKIGLHAALTPTWSETAWFADYVLPMGLGTERHDTMSQETHAGRWLGFRQPVKRVALEKMGKPVTLTHESNPGEVWEEAEFLDRALVEDRSDGSLGIRKFFESPYRPARRSRLTSTTGGSSRTRCPAFPKRRRRKDLTPLQYMRKYGAFKVDEVAYSKAHEKPLGAEVVAGSSVEAASGLVSKDGAVVGVVIDDLPRTGFNTPSRKLEFYSPTLAAWGWPEHAVPKYAPGHVHWRDLNRAENEFDLLPNFRLPTLVHTRSTVKWALRDLEQQSAVDFDAGRRQAGPRRGRPREDPHRHRLVRHARLGHRGHPSPASSACRIIWAAGGSTKIKAAAATRPRSCALRGAAMGVTR